MKSITDKVKHVKQIKCKVHGCQRPAAGILSLPFPASVAERSGLAEDLEVNACAVHARRYYFGVRE